MSDHDFDEPGTANGISRRRLIGTAAATTAAAAAAGIPGAASAAPKRPHGKHRAEKVDVVVVGAGLAGLTAARNLVGIGSQVRLLEARDRVGGRICNHQLPGKEVTEIGGQFVGPTQDRILALAKDVGVKTFPGYNPGQNVYIDKTAGAISTAATSRRTRRRCPTSRSCSPGSTRWRRPSRSTRPGRRRTRGPSMRRPSRATSAGTPPIPSACSALSTCS